MESSSVTGAPRVPPEEIKAIPVRHYGRWIAAAIVVVFGAAALNSMRTNENFEWGVVRQYLFTHSVIHGCIYEARPDVTAVCHHHAPSVMPFCIAGVPIEPVFHLGAATGETTPFWDQQDEFGDTDLLVKTAEEGASLARALGDNWTVLLRRHGATVAGTSIREMVFRTIYGCVNAELQWKAQQQGHVQRLTPGEAARGGGHNIKAGPLERAWDYWEHRLMTAGGHPGGAKAKPAAAKARSTTPKQSAKKRKR